MKLPSFGLLAIILAVSAVGYFLIFPKLSGTVAAVAAPKA